MISNQQQLSAGAGEAQASMSAVTSSVVRMKRTR